MTDDPAEVLAHPPTDEDLDELLESARSQRRSKLTTFLVAALIFVTGFLLGSVAEKTVVAINEAQNTESDGGNQQLGQDPYSVIISGTVRIVEDDTVYLEQANGGTLKVIAEATTLVGVSAPGEMGDLRPGDEVIIRGSTEPDGSLLAASIQQSHPGS